MQVSVVSTQLWRGDNDLVLDLLDADSVRLDDPELTATLRLTRPDGSPAGEYDLERIQFATWGRTLYRARVALDTTGRWGMTVTGQASDGRTLIGDAQTQVLDDAGSPPLGQPVVPVDTPTIVSSGYDLATITTDTEPLQQLYLTSVRDALEAKHAFAFVIDTLRPGVNSACGSALGEARTIPSAFPGLWVIHAEPFVTDSGDGVLVTPPVDGSADLAPWATAWGVTEPPWLFIVDDDGTLWAKFQGIFGTDELLSALRGVAAYVPGGH